jgi:2-polyprenyl-3-methyl-5-hydroxy-6-metoxy-1,4-benzoquinol methylase
MLEKALVNTYPAWSRGEVLPYVPRDARRILDVGCGAGGFGAHLTARDVFGVEPNATAADLAAAHYQVVYRGVFPEAVPRGATFDCIVFNDVLEHLVDPWSAVRASIAMLTDRGTVIASIPNMRYMRVLRRLLFNADWTYQSYGVLDRTHLRWFTYKTMRKLFEDNGFVVDRLVPINVENGWKARLIRLVPYISDLAALQFVVVARPITHTFLGAPQVDCDPAA